MTCPVCNYNKDDFEDLHGMDPDLNNGFGTAVLEGRAIPYLAQVLLKLYKEHKTGKEGRQQERIEYL